jgi:hypothetical protein
MEWDHLGVVARVQVEVQAEEAEVLEGWAATVLELAPAEIVSARIAGREWRIGQASLATT